MKQLTARLDKLEALANPKAPQLPALVVFGKNDLEAKRAEFIATHGRPPELELVIERAAPV